MKEEVFGPAIVNSTFKTEDEAIAKANETWFSLYAALSTKDLERAIRVSKKLESETVVVSSTSSTGSWDSLFHPSVDGRGAGLDGTVF
jgi:aldehyde dehydrogenase (NAD+)